MNLLHEPWLPVRLHATHGGGREWIAPHQLSDPRIAAFDADRADFNGALAQFAIGLLQTTSPVDSGGAWRDHFDKPPSVETLQSWFTPHSAAFEFSGDGARFMQDFELRVGDAEPVAIGNLLIEAPGENTIKNNSDHFIKRGLVEGLCPHCAALALFTLQTNAPAGGAGNRTGLRGGGPLTTLLVVDGGADSARSLWHTLWLNVQQRHVFLAHGGDDTKTAAHFTFPWLAGISAIQPTGGETAPTQTHPAHVFWAMPRRIRLDNVTGNGICDLCGRASDHLVSQYVTRPQGLNYKGPWKHPLSPYYQAKEGWLPLHPQPGGLGYRHWLGWVLGMQNDKRAVECAMVVEQFLQNSVSRGIGLRLWAFGYDMDNMKARCWYDATVPLFALADCAPSVHKALRDEIGSWLNGAEQAASYLRGAVKDAWFSTDARGDFSAVDASFWSRTEPFFYQRLRARLQAASESQPTDRVATAESWLVTLRTAALHLFDDEWVGTGPIERQNPARVAQAHRQLRANLDGPKLRAALGLPFTPKSPAKTGKTTAAPTLPKEVSP
ncbi:MAG: type I-E CRISPR-associated protein Cse1/CasA [Burkholderiales bacterium]